LALDGSARRRTEGAVSPCARFAPTSAASGAFLLALAAADQRHQHGPQGELAGLRLAGEIAQKPPALLIASPRCRMAATTVAAWRSPMTSTASTVALEPEPAGGQACPKLASQVPHLLPPPPYEPRTLGRTVFAYISAAPI